MNQADRAVPDSKADNSKIATKRNVNVSGAKVKNKVAVNRAAASRADVKIGSLGKTAAGGDSRRLSFVCRHGSPYICQLDALAGLFVNHPANKLEKRNPPIRY